MILHNFIRLHVGIDVDFYEFERIFVVKNEELLDFVYQNLGSEDEKHLVIDNEKMT